MNTYTALLRWINVSGQKIINMKDFKALLLKNGFENAMTYIQSWNIVFQSSETDKEILSKKINKLIEDHYNFQVPILILKASEVHDIIAQNPFITGNKDISKLHITLLSGLPSDMLLSQIRDEKYQSDECVIQWKTIYLYCPDGYGMTKFSTIFFEKKLGVTATTRNWKTIQALHDLIKISQTTTVENG